jgi:preprotein translocase subunit SecY
VVGEDLRLLHDLPSGDPYYELIFLSLIIFFTFFYVSIVFNVEEVADNLRKHGGFHAGHSSGPGDG